MTVFRSTEAVAALVLAQFFVLMPLPALARILRDSPVFEAGADPEFRRGLAAYRAMKYRHAYEIWEKVARRGDAKAQSALGYLHFKGLGQRQSDAAAMRWYAPAAEAGEPVAQYHLGLIYLRGHGVGTDPYKALVWCERAVLNGFPEALECKQRAEADLPDYVARRGESEAANSPEFHR
ncbi:MAG: tetratricopeptide repeat protein [Beijerinckiaceae bacterium]